MDRRNTFSGFWLLRMCLGVQCLWLAHWQFFDELMQNFELQRDREFSFSFARIIKGTAAPRRAEELRDLVPERFAYNAHRIGGWRPAHCICAR